MGGAGTAVGGTAVGWATVGCAAVDSPDVGCGVSFRSLARGWACSAAVGSAVGPSVAFGVAFRSAGVEAVAVVG